MPNNSIFIKLPLQKMNKASLLAKVHQSLLPFRSAMKIASGRPEVLLDRGKCANNIRTMVDKANLNGLTLRPHFKTHQSLEIGSWFREQGVNQATVSSATMAHYFYKGGWTDITIAFPFNVLEWPTIAEMAQRIKLNVTITSSDALPPLLACAPISMGVFLKIDVGTHRTGFDYRDLNQIKSAISKIDVKDGLRFMGFLCHAGHSYQCKNGEGIQQIHNEVSEIMHHLKNTFASGHPDLICSVGDTPTSSLGQGWNYIDEIRPGNFVFYDLMQVSIGACSINDIAVALSCPVVAKHNKHRRSVIVYGGGIHLSKDRMSWGDKTIYGLPCLHTDQGWAMPDGESYLSGLSQEHGVIQASAEFFDSVNVGDRIAVLPVHSCMMCDLMKSYLLLKDGRRINMMQYN